MQENRIALWDNLKFVLILAVVVGHMADNFTDAYSTFRSIFVFIYSFHMPLFIFVSGLFFKPVNIKNKALYYFFAGLALAITNAIFRIIINGNTSFSILAESGIPWFMFSLAIMTVLAYALRDVNKIFLLIISIVFAMFVGYDNNIGDFLYLSRTIIFFPFFIIGVMMNSDDIIAFRENHRYLVIIAAFVLVAWALITIIKIDKVYDFRWLFTGRNSFDNCGSINGPFGRLAAYGISGLISAAVVLLIPAKKIPIVSRMGARSIDVYFWHSIMLSLLELLFPFATIVSSTSGKVFYLLIAVVITALLSIGVPFSYPLLWIKKSICKIYHS